MTSTLVQTAPHFYVDPAYRPLLEQAGLATMTGIFDFSGGESLNKANLAGWRQRIRFQLPDGQTAYLKRYMQPPLSVQLKAWLQHGAYDFLSSFDKGPVGALADAGVAIPRTIACGGRRTGPFEACSFIITLELPQSQSLETQLPACFESNTPDARREKRAFIVQLADFVRRFHATGYRHRDLYLAHLFLSDGGELALIDLQRCFRPRLFTRRFRIKDLAQLHYSSPADRVTRTDRFRFYRAYQQTDRLSGTDKRLLAAIDAKARRIARHDRKHGRTVPFETEGRSG